MNEAFEKIIAEVLELAEPNGNPYIDCADVIEIVNQVAEEYSNDGWIPVSERLPEISDRYLCQIERTSYSYMDILYFSKNLEEVDEYDFMGKKCAGFYSYDSEYGHCEYEGVIAWQPLPEPYKQKGEK